MPANVSLVGDVAEIKPGIPRLPKIKLWKKLFPFKLKQQWRLPAVMGCSHLLIVIIIFDSICIELVFEIVS